MTVETAPWPAVAEPTTPIRPSEALRLGRLRFPERAKGLFQQGGAACAIGSAMAGMNPLDLRAALSRPAKCPACTWWTADAWWIVMHVNDDHHWSDAQIVAWLESLGL